MSQADDAAKDFAIKNFDNTLRDLFKDIKQGDIIRITQGSQALLGQFNFITKEPQTRFDIPLANQNLKPMINLNINNGSTHSSLFNGQNFLLDPALRTSVVIECKNNDIKDQDQYAQRFYPLPPHLGGRKQRRKSYKKGKSYKKRKSYKRRNSYRKRH